MRTIRLETSDEVVFEIDYEIIKCSETIRKALQNLGEEDDAGVLPVPKVNSAILEKVLIWATYHKDDVGIVVEEDEEVDVDEDEAKRTDDICAWDKQFLDVDQTTLCEIILAANYLHIQALLNTTYKTVANMIKGKTTEEIRQMFSLVNDFTPEDDEEDEDEEDEAEWCDDD